MREKSVEEMGHKGAMGVDRRHRVMVGSADASMRLICFPHAGGSTFFYHPWRSLISSHVELVAVRYPGGIERLDEDPADSVETLADSLADVLTGGPGAELPVVLFGHSLGALVAYEFAQRMEARGRSVEHLFLSGSSAPHRRRRGTVWTRDDDDFWAAVRRLGGIDDSFMEQRELLDALLPGMRADFRMAETYGPRPARTLECPVTVLTGASDPGVPLDSAYAWNDITEDEFAVRVLPGGHFYLVDEMNAVTQLVNSCLRSSRSIHADSARDSGERR
ncbi:thioesterase II family protein [Streptomyces niveus]|uniref:thioesterase II family protein n=1 Tax=Streptomyces niveus TaxID=193462 RepID=UPI0036D2CF1C